MKLLPCKILDKKYPAFSKINSIGITDGFVCKISFLKQKNDVQIYRVFGNISMWTKWHLSKGQKGEIAKKKIIHS